MAERRSAHGARVVYEYQFPYAEPEDAAPTEFFGFSPEKLASLSVCPGRS
jgi:hypothetical protein